MKNTGNSINKKNNNLLYLFRLLTIEYRVKYPMQGKGYNLDLDVKNELLHTIVKAIDNMLSGKWQMIIFILTRDMQNK